MLYTGRPSKKEDLSDAMVAVPRQPPPDQHHVLRLRAQQDLDAGNQGEMQAVHEAEAVRGGAPRGVLGPQPLRGRGLRLANRLRKAEPGDVRPRKGLRRKPTVLLGTTAFGVRIGFRSHPKCLHGSKVCAFACKGIALFFTLNFYIVPNTTLSTPSPI